MSHLSTTIPALIALTTDLNRGLVMRLPADDWLRVKVEANQSRTSSGTSEQAVSENSSSSSLRRLEKYRLLSDTMTIWIIINSFIKKCYNTKA